MEELINTGLYSCFSKPTDRDLLSEVIGEAPYFYWSHSKNGWELYHPCSPNAYGFPAYSTEELFRYLLKPKIEVNNEKLYQVMSRTDEGGFELGYIRENGECISEVGKTLVETQTKLIETLFIKRLV